jgi:peptide/nickel transport system ATP-binding protein
MNPEALLRIKDFELSLNTDAGRITALNRISLHINHRETLGVVGESGCGKSLTALSVMRLLPYNGRVERGEIIFNGQNLLSFNPKKMRSIRGNDISMIFQEPMTSLNPVYTVGNQLLEAIRLHQRADKKTAQNIAVDALARVGIPLPEKRLKEYPHQLSGGMRQRVMIAMALACEPRLLIADEPTTALDVTIQAQILRIIRGLTDTMDMSVMLITHDLGVVAKMCDRVMVMYAGEIVEEGPVGRLFAEPLHPYSRGLLASIPKLKGDLPFTLPVVRGMVPQLYNMPSGCRFHPRCDNIMDICRTQSPPLFHPKADRHVQCWKYRELS